MKIIFNVDYRTNWGESVYLTGDVAALGNGDYTKAVPMTLKGVENWTAEVEIPAGVSTLNYRYIVRNENGQTKTEWGHGNRLKLADGDTMVCVYDRWQDQPFDKPYYSSAFTECICRQDKRAAAVVPAMGCTTFAVAAPMVRNGRVLALSGSCLSLIHI